MLPSDYVWLASMPLTSSGKIDRQALAVSGRPTGSRPSYVAPRSPTEETLSTIWSEVLKVQKIGINDNFFELGGHSLLATKLITYAGDAFAVELPLLSVFEEPTLAGFAQRVELAQREQKDLSRISEILNQVENLSDDDLSRLLDPGAIA
jgi:acyl carrier protein